MPVQYCSIRQGALMMRAIFFACGCNFSLLSRAMCSMLATCYFVFLAIFILAALCLL